jgi:hypothetical protein
MERNKSIEGSKTGGPSYSDKKKVDGGVAVGN